MAQNRIIKQTAPGETTVYINPRWDAGTHYEKEIKKNQKIKNKIKQIKGSDSMILDKLCLCHEPSRVGTFFVPTR